MRQSLKAPQWNISFLPSPTKNALLMNRNKYRVGIMREEVHFILFIDSNYREPIVIVRWLLLFIRVVWNLG